MKKLFGYGLRKKISRGLPRPKNKFITQMVYGILAGNKVHLSETHENLCCLEPLSAHFPKTCVRTLDRGFDGNEYYKYLLFKGECFG